MSGKSKRNDLHGLCGQAMTKGNPPGWAGGSLLRGISRFDVYCRKRLAQRVCKRRAKKISPFPIVSFTFDDFPRSALTGAGTMLSEKGLHGTYYVSMGLMGQPSSLGQMCDVGDLQTLVAEGHELACHTFGHLYCPHVSAEQLARECERNQSAVAEALNGYRLQNFSFPSGAVTWTAKSTLMTMYDSCRTIEWGINTNIVDLGFLQANPIYSRRPISWLNRIIEENAKQAGWLILYTHDVRDHHSDVGCTPAHFREILDRVIASGAAVMTINKAVKTFQAQD